MVDPDESSEDDPLSYLSSTGILPELVHLRLPRLTGSLPGKRANVTRNFDAAMIRLLIDYFGSVQKYRESKLARQFRMSRKVFEHVLQKLDGKGIFVQRVDGLGKRGIHPLYRIVAAVRMLAYGFSEDALDE
eukprot:gb/GEZJ01006746.1/.p1 GENE.gb/GEZJ01006746.1/~~gb/GEZJ01006746.1/.p1  ORF type:complete len:132 (-),score=23.40 gb/GEZJ01006746.1/:102-497(-)